MRESTLVRSPAANFAGQAESRHPVAALREARKNSRPERINNWLWRVVVAHGLVPRSWPGKPRIGSMTLVTRGRRSGLERTVPVTWIELHGERYLVAMMGEQSDWIHNVRATNGVAKFKRGRTKEALLEELPVPERAPILQAWLSRTGFSGVPRKYVGLPRDASLAEFEKIAPKWPVFRIVSANAIP